VHLVALPEQELGQIGAVLAGDPGDEGALGHVVRLRALDGSGVLGFTLLGS
jgi:hypothetical protein